MNTQHKLIIFYATALQFIWGVILLFASTPPLIVAFDSILNFVGNSHLLGLIFIVTALLSLWGSKGDDLKSLLKLIPQQFIMFLAAGSAIKAIMLSSYADGVIRPRVFIATDQISVILIALFYLMAVIQVYSGWRKIK